MAQTIPEGGIPEGGDAVLEVAARRAYERGRARLALQRAAFPALMLLAAIFLLHARLWVALPLGLTLVAGFSYTQYRGQSLGRGARRGLLFGVLPFVVPWVVHNWGICWLGDTCSTTCLRACFLFGCLSGISVGLSATRDASPPRYALGAWATLLLTACLGCTAIGLGELVGVLAGLVLVAPVYIVRVARG